MEPNYSNGNTTTGKPFSGLYTNRFDIDKMPETPQRGFHHRRAQSDNFLLGDDFFDMETDFNFASLDIPSMSEENDDSSCGGGGVSMVVDSGKAVESNNGGRVGGITHFRSLSVDADFFDGLGLQSSVIVGGGSGGGGEESGGNGGNLERRKHRHSNSMDGSSSSFELGSCLSMDYSKKVTGPERLAELALIDPKRARRILANRQSAARSKERKTRYTSELERKVQTLQTEATTLSAKVTMLQNDKTGLSNENKELKLRLQSFEAQAQLRDALHETLRDEVNRLRLVAGELPSLHGNSRRQVLSAAHQFGVTPQHQTQVPQSSNQVQGGQPRHGSLNLHQRV